MADEDKLKNMLDDLINNKPEQAQVNFRDYLQGKMQEVLRGEHQVELPVRDEKQK